MSERHKSNKVREQNLARGEKIRVILQENIPGLGRLGDEVAVRPGYARNFLLAVPRNLKDFKDSSIFPSKALRATAQNRAHFEKVRAELEAKYAALKAVAEKAKAALMLLPALTLSHEVNEDGVLYGSVTAKEVAEAIMAVGGTVTAGDIHLPGHIKAVGSYAFEVLLHPEVKAMLQINVVGSTELLNSQNNEA